MLELISKEKLLELISKEKLLELISVDKLLELTRKEQNLLQLISEEKKLGNQICMQNKIPSLYEEPFVIAGHPDSG